MVCQSCLGSTTKTDMIDMYEGFTGHELCFTKQELAKYQDSTIESYENQLSDYVDEVSELCERVATLEEELLLAESLTDEEQKIRRAREFRD